MEFCTINQNLVCTAHGEEVDVDELECMTGYRERMEEERSSYGQWRDYYTAQ